jgi:putative PIN family toxin of toxin-antitoxin system
MRVVIDTNILVSGLFTPSGNSTRILSLALNWKLVPLCNVSILEEYRAVLGRPKFAFQQYLYGNANILPEGMVRGIT